MREDLLLQLFDAAGALVGRHVVHVVGVGPQPSIEASAGRLLMSAHRSASVISSCGGAHPPSKLAGLPIVPKAPTINRTKTPRPASIRLLRSSFLVVPSTSNRGESCKRLTVAQFRGFRERQDRSALWG